MVKSSQDLLQIIVETEDVLENYEIILRQADRIDPLHESCNTKQLLHILLGKYLPIIKDEVKQVTERFPDDTDDKTCTSICKIKEIEDKYGKRSHDQSTMKSFLSPVVLLLRLAEEAGSFSFAPRKEWQQCDWGQLGSFRKYIQDLRSRYAVGKDKHYYPGLPGCILSLAPV